MFLEILDFKEECKHFVIGLFFLKKKKGGRGGDTFSD